MKLVIDIPKEMFELIKSDEHIDWLDVEHIVFCIKKGQPLEEGERK